jgi:polyphosphate kinase 2 (PPK2 family)
MKCAISCATVNRLRVKASVLHWDEYTAAYEDALRKCSTEESPWYVIPANNKTNGSSLLNW